MSYEIEIGDGPGPELDKYDVRIPNELPLPNSSLICNELTFAANIMQITKRVAVENILVENSCSIVELHS